MILTTNASVPIDPLRVACRGAAVGKFVEFVSPVT